MGVPVDSEAPTSLDHVHHDFAEDDAWEDTDEIPDLSHEGGEYNDMARVFSNRFSGDR
jgi:hypothetical protein